MFVITDENDTPYSFNFEKKPEGLENVSNGDTVTVKYTGTVLTNPDPGRFYPCDDNGELTFSDGRMYKGPFNRGRMEGDNATFIYPNGDTYTGSFYDNHFSKGTYTVKTTGEQFIDDIIQNMVGVV